jgi:hypothetical protein
MYSYENHNVSSLLLVFCAVIVTSTKNPCGSFFILSNMSEDAEFQGLSETRVMFLGRRDTTRLKANY